MQGEVDAPRQVQVIATRGHTHRLCVVLPEPIAHLTLTGKCVQIMTLARCHSKNPRNRVLQGFPPDRYLQNLRTDAVVIDSGFQLRACDFDNLSSMLRSWAPAIMSIPDHGGGDNHVEHDLRQALRWLASASDALSIGARPGMQYSGRLYTNMELIDWLRLSSMLRDQSRLDVVLRRAMAVVFSGSLVQQLDDCLGNRRTACPHKSTISRMRLTLDMAFMLHRRAVVEGPPMFRAGWIDSSPILGYDLLMSRRIGRVLRQSCNPHPRRGHRFACFFSLASQSSRLSDFFSDLGCLS